MLLFPHCAQDGVLARAGPDVTSDNPLLLRSAKLATLSLAGSADVADSSASTTVTSGTVSTTSELVCSVSFVFDAVSLTGGVSSLCLLSPVSWRSSQLDCSLVVGFSVVSEVFRSAICGKGRGK